jgi:hypothetical protein
MTPAEFVEKLDKVRQSGNSRWTARCPAHADKNPSLSVSEGDDGRVLVKCFAGCSIVDIAGAVGVQVSDLMPERLPGHRYRPIRKPYPAADVLEMLATETMIVWLAACDMAAGKQLTDAQRERLNLAAQRIEAARGGR